jgi:hypothetical protein
LTQGFRGVILAGMQTLGLSGESKRSDGRLKSIFWPTVENAWDVNYLGEQGFWILNGVAVVELVVSALMGNTVLLISGVVTFFVYVMGAMGVREANWPAAAMVFSVYFAGMLGGLAVGRLPGVVAVIIAGVLLSNVRAAFLASEWKPLDENEDRPTRFNETLADKFSDQLPAKLWPMIQIPFFALASVLLLLEFIGVGAALLQRFGILHSQLRP